MKRELLTLILLVPGLLLFGQVNSIHGGVFAQSYSKEITEYRVKEFIIRDILQIPDKQTIEVHINALTASKSGQLTTIIYDCKELAKRGLVFGFWNDQINDFNLRYQGYAFKNFEFEKSKDLLDNLEKVLEEKNDILSAGNEDLSKNALYKFDDIIFIFYKDVFGANQIRVLWNGFDSEWNQSNLQTMKRRFYKYFINKK